MLVNQPFVENRSPRWWSGVALVLAVSLAAACAVLVSAPIRAAAPGDAKSGKSPGKLSYHDGTDDSKRSLGGSGELIAFTLPGDSGKVAGIRIHGSRYGLPQPPKEDFMIYFLNGDLTETIATKTAPYSLFKRGKQEWVDVKFPKPVEVPKDFWICLDFRAQQTKGVYVSIDTSTDGSHSKIGLPGMEIRDANLGGDWMVEALVK